MVATFNVLPMIPLDGGYMFKDIIDAFLKKVRVNLAQEKREKIALNITTIISLLILFIVLAPIIVPNIMKFF
jgi:membrane-associated protease RseP (regulator of RpoE activity)